MKPRDKHKLKLANDTLKTFVDQFGPDDIYRDIFLEVFLEELYGKSLPVPSKKKQEGSKDSSNDEGRMPPSPNP